MKEAIKMKKIKKTHKGKEKVNKKEKMKKKKEREMWKGCYFELVEVGGVEHDIFLILVPSNC